MFHILCLLMEDFFPVRIKVELSRDFAEPFLVRTMHVTIPLITYLQLK